MGINREKPKIIPLNLNGFIETRTQTEHNYEVAICKSVAKTARRELEIESGLSRGEKIMHEMKKKRKKNSDNSRTKARRIHSRKKFDGHRLTGAATGNT